MRVTIESRTQTVTIEYVVSVSVSPDGAVILDGVEVARADDAPALDTQIPYALAEAHPSIFDDDAPDCVQVMDMTITELSSGRVAG